MSTSREKRISKELSAIRNDAEHSGVDATPIGDNLSQLLGSFVAPPDTPYAGGRYTIMIELPQEYPFKPPTMRFNTKIWHPNISSITGAICLDTLSSGWTPVQTIKSLLMSLRMLLENPNPKDPQDAEVAKSMLSDPEKFARNAHEWAVRYADAPRSEKQSWPGYVNGPAEPTKQSPMGFRGYHENMIQRFVAMGFDPEAVLDAFEFVGIDRCNGADYELEEAYIGDITARLLGEH